MASFHPSPSKLRLLLCVLAAPLLAWAQAYPSKPIRMIVPFPAGGPADIFGRGLAHGMSEQLGQPVVVENIGGVGGVLGVDRALKSAPDGYTLGFNSGSTLSIAPYSFSKLPYDVKKDAGLITLVVRVPEVLAVHPSLPVNSLAGIVDVPILLGHVRSGKLKALAVTSASRAPTLADVPTTAEGKLPNVTSDNWYGLVVPAATPADIQKRIHA